MPKACQQGKFLLVPGKGGEALEFFPSINGFGENRLQQRELGEVCEETRELEEGFG